MPSSLPLPNPSNPIWTRWKALIDQILGNPLNSIQILEGVALASGNTVINHKLGRKQQGWLILDLDGAATIYRSAAFNDLTLTLNSTAQVNVNIGVF